MTTTNGEWTARFVDNRRRLARRRTLRNQFQRIARTVERHTRRQKEYRHKISVGLFDDFGISLFEPLVVNRDHFVFVSFELVNCLRVGLDKALDCVAVFFQKHAAHDNYRHWKIRLQVA